MRDRRVAPDLSAVVGACPVEDEALRSVDRPDRVEHREGRLGARAPGHFALGQPGARISLQQNMREVAPLRALADQVELGRALDRHLILDEGGDLLRRRARELRQRRPPVAEDPRIPVLVGAEGSGDLHLLEQGAERFHRVRLGGVLRIVRHVVDAGIRLCVLALESRHKHAAFAFRVQDEGDRALGGCERKARVVEDVVGVEEHRACEVALEKVLGQPCQPLLIFRLLDRQAHAARSFSRQSGSSSRSRRTRSPTGGCVTNRAARPTSRNGLMV